MMRTGWAIFFAGSLIIIGFMFSAASMAGNSQTIMPGKYEVTSKMRTNIDNSLSKKTIERCIQGNTINPESFLPDKDRCSLKNLKIEGNNSSFDIRCTAPSGLDLTGHMEFSTQETSFTYKFTLKAPYEDRVFELDGEGSAVRVGDC